MLDNTKQTVLDALEFHPPSYVPWAWKMTIPCARRVSEYLGGAGTEEFIATHFFDVKSPVRRYESIGDGRFRDTYGIVWDRTVDPDVGTPLEWPIRQPADLAKYRFPIADDPQLYEFIPPVLAQHQGQLRRYCIGFSLYERAWTLRGMTALLIDMLDEPSFVDDLLDAIVEHNLVQIRWALKYDFDAFHFGDDYGMQTGLIMGMDHWRRFIKPRLARLFEPVRQAGKLVFLHSCGQIEQLLDDLVEIGLNCLDPFQPEVMDTQKVFARCRGRLALHGGMSIQKVLPFGTTNDVRRETHRLLEMGKGGGFIFAPSHAVPGDVPPANLAAMMEVLQGQEGYRTLSRQARGGTQ
jgi:uroporphyrinogen decarboxylase